MSKQYIIIAVIVIAALLLTLFIGMDRMNTEEKADDVTDDGRKKYFWEPAISSPRKYPVEVFKADFILDKKPNKEGNVRVRSYFGPDALESDKDTFWELVYKNFEGDHSNEFRGK